LFRSLSDNPATPRVFHRGLRTHIQGGGQLRVTAHAQGLRSRRDPGGDRPRRAVVRRLRDAHRPGRHLVLPGLEVEDAPFVAVELASEGAGSGQLLKLRTNLDEWVPVDDAHPLAMRAAPDGSQAPYLRVRDSLDARVSRSAFYHMVELAEPSPDGAEGVIGVWSAGRFFPLGATEG
jgi:hypothetical protein